MKRGLYAPLGQRATLTRLIAQWRDSLIDLEAVVDDRRKTVDRAVEGLREAVRERDRGAAHLARLVDWHEELEAVADAFGPEIADRFAADPPQHAA